MPLKDYIRRSSTRRHTRYWKTRKIDWEKDYLLTWTHPHRQLIIDFLKTKSFGSVCELGCASGPNLVRIRKEFPSVQLGGVDVAPDAIALARRVFPDGIFEVRSAHDLFFSDKSVDVTLTDMALIYLSKREFRKALKEIRRITRKYCIFVEFHHVSWFKRLALKLGVGYNAYDWPKELEAAGFHDIEIRKIRENEWPDGEAQRAFGFIITCRV